MLAHDREGRGQLGEGAAELSGILGAIEGAACGPGYVHQRAIVGVERVARQATRAAEAPAAEVPAEVPAAEPADLRRAARKRRRIVCAVPDREDAHAPACRLPRRGLRVDPLVV